MFHAKQRNSKKFLLDLPKIFRTIACLRLWKFSLQKKLSKKTLLWEATSDYTLLVSKKWCSLHLAEDVWQKIAYLESSCSIYLNICGNFRWKRPSIKKWLPGMQYITPC